LRLRQLFNKIRIAGLGEIALCIIRACKDRYPD
jgi:hypothetical protein